MAGSTKLLTSSGGGVILTPASNIASDVTVNIPSVNGTLVNTGSTGQVTQTMLSTNVAGNGPAFSAYPSGTQTVTSGVYTKVACNTKEFDTASAFDSTTNYRFTPLVSGYYQVNGLVGTNGTATTSCAAAIYKNGSAAKYGAYIQTVNADSSVSALIYMNGTTDYLEMYAYVSATVASIGNGASSTYFQAALVRAA